MSTSTVHRDAYRYCAHPHALALADGTWLCVFNMVPRREVVLHPPQDPEFRNVLIRSDDEGRSWSAPVVVPGYGWSGVECAGLAQAADGTVLLTQWQFDWQPLPTAQVRSDRSGWAMPSELAHGLFTSPEIAGLGQTSKSPEALMPWARGPGRAVVHRSRDGGRTFAETVPVWPGYAMRGMARLGDGTLILPLCDIPAYETVVTLRSVDHGTSWSEPTIAARLDGRLFEEPCPIVLSDDRILMLLRENVGSTLWQTISDDAGRRWSTPTPTGIDGFPAHLLRLQDGRLLCTYGFRRPPFAIRCVVSTDEGRSWTAPIAIRSDMDSRDLGYPATLQRRDGTLVCLHYARDAAGVTGIDQSLLELQ